ncbi:MAG TPA: trehalase-like domain-containing protein, partial [Ktedonobacterales bacterium]|nr:trehalase-like domain-containing protein [Ktedonobacterales bacterium]
MSLQRSSLQRGNVMSSPEQIRATSEMALLQRYHPISHYGVIGDCRTAALIAPDGSIDWCCLPHFDSPAIFCRLLDAERGGYFRIAPDTPMTTATAYIPGTNVLETIFGTGPSGGGDAGQVRLTDFMPIRPRQRIGHRASHVASSLAPQLPEGRLREGLEHVAGNDVAAAHRLTRIATAEHGDHTLSLTVKATFDYARQLPSIE